VNSREKILSRIRNRKMMETALPDLSRKLTTWDDPIGRFRETVSAVGGHTERLSDPSLLPSVIEKLDDYQAASRVASNSFIAKLDLDDLTRSASPHSLADIDLFIADGDIGVAENGAIWVTDEKLVHNAALFITQHLILTVYGSAIVNNMHEAYEKIDPQESHFGVFISGPSKTADIEQSLVIGAHGARSLMVYIVDDSETGESE
jgi:L-lactate dehydrogenase complex protein LldG